MIKDIMTTNETVAINEKQMQVLREHFPACFHDGEFDLERFKEYLGDSLTVNNEGCQSLRVFYSPAKTGRNNRKIGGAPDGKKI